MAPHLAKRPSRRGPHSASAPRPVLGLAMVLLAGILGCRPKGPSASLDLLERSTKALRGVQTVRYRATAKLPLTDAWGSGMRSEAMEIEYVVGDQGLARTLLPHEGALADEIVCTGSACWWRVGQHPWSEAPGLSATSFTSYLEERQRALSQAKVVGTEYVVGTSHIVVTWALDLGTEADLRGQSWLDTNTFLPTREAYSVTDADGQLTMEIVIEYLEYDRPTSILTPAPATVTPVPTIALGDRPPLPIHEEAALPLGLIVAPDLPGAYVGVVVLGNAGRQAAMRTDLARRLAQHGYVALSYCYTTCPGAPDILAGVDAANVAEAVAHVRAYPSVAGEAVGLVGVGRGAELALIATALGVDAQAVVAISAPAQVGPAAAPDREAWVYQAQPLSFTEIPVEDIDAPVLLIHGQGDAQHPVTGAYRMAERRWDAAKPCELAIYPVGDETLYRSSPDVTARVVDFLDRTLYYLR